MRCRSPHRIAVLAVALALATLACDGELKRGAPDGSGADQAGPPPDGSARDVRDAGDGAAADAPGDAASTDAPRADGPSSAPTCASPDPAWLLCDNFEGFAGGWSGWRQASGWTEILGEQDRGRVTSSSTEAHSGSYSLYMPAAASSGYQGADLIWRACVGQNQAGCKQLAGYPELYLRAYIRFAPDHRKVHHFLAIGGGPLDDYWAPYGNAGCRPNGTRAMGTTVDFDAKHATFFYTYFPQMNCDSGSTCANYNDPAQICADCATKGMPCSNGQECCWGNTFRPQPDVVLPLGKWFCFEMMMRANTVGQSDGEMAYWIDGKLAHQVKTMQWRTANTLQLNMVRLQHYLTTGDAQGFSNQVWFDDVVISTARVGCQAASR